MRVDADEHVGRVGHADKIGPYVDGIGRQQGHRCNYQNRFGELFPERSRQSLACHHANPRAHHLHGRHQRPCEKCGPQQGGSKLRAGNGISGYP